MVSDQQHSASEGDEEGTDNGLSTVATSAVAEKKSIKAALEQYEKKKFGLKPLGEALFPEILEESISVIETKTADELNWELLNISKYILFFRRQINEERAWRAWAKQTRDRLVAKELQAGNIKNSLGFNQQQLVATYSTAELESINKFIRELDIKILRLEGVDDSIQKFSDILNSIKIGKMMKNKEQERHSH